MSGLMKTIGQIIGAEKRRTGEADLPFLIAGSYRGQSGYLMVHSSDKGVAAGLVFDVDHATRFPDAYSAEVTAKRIRKQQEGVDPDSVLGNFHIVEIGAQSNDNPR